MQHGSIIICSSWIENGSIPRNFSLLVEAWYKRLLTVIKVIKKAKRGNGRMTTLVKWYSHSPWIDQILDASNNCDIYFSMNKFQNQSPKPQTSSQAQEVMYGWSATLHICVNEEFWVFSFKLLSVFLHNKFLFYFWVQFRKEKSDFPDISLICSDRKIF